MFSSEHPNLVPLSQLLPRGIVVWNRVSVWKVRLVTKCLRKCTTLGLLIVFPQPTSLLPFLLFAATGAAAVQPPSPRVPQALAVPPPAAPLRSALGALGAQPRLRPAINVLLAISVQLDRRQRTLMCAPREGS